MVANFAAYAARYGVAGLPDIPAAELSVAEAWVVAATDGRDKSLDNYAAAPFPPYGAKEKEIALPDGYEAVCAVGAISAAPQLANWRDWTDWDNNSAGDDGVSEHVGWHEIVATLDVGGRTARASTVDGDQRPDNTVTIAPGVYHGYWLNEEFRWIDDQGQQVRELPLDTNPTGKVAVSAAIGGTYEASVSVSVTCRPTEATWSSWRQEVFARISAAHADLLSRWQNEQASLQDDDRPPLPTGSPARNKEVVREELKRQVIEMLIGESFEGSSQLRV